MSYDREKVLQIIRGISLFKSKQEHLFYLTARAVFQTYMLFQNISLSATLDWDNIKHQLSQAEKITSLKL